MSQALFLAPAAARSFLAERDIDFTYTTGATVERTNNRVQEFGEPPEALAPSERLHGDLKAITDIDGNITGWRGVVLFDETIPQVRGGIAEIEVKTRAFKVFAVYLIDSSAAKLTAIHAALQAHKPYYGDITSIPATAATKNALPADVAQWRDAADDAGKTQLAIKLAEFHMDVMDMVNLADFRQAMRDVLGITQADIDRVAIGQTEES